MKPVPFNKWISRAEAGRITEGSAVVVRKPVNPPSYEKHFIYDVHGWFRPDYIKSDPHYFGKGDEEYMLLETPIRRPEKGKK